MLGLPVVKSWLETIEIPHTATDRDYPIPLRLWHLNYIKTRNTTPNRNWNRRFQLLFLARAPLHTKNLHCVTGVKGPLVKRKILKLLLTLLYKQVTRKTDFLQIFACKSLVVSQNAMSNYVGKRVVSFEWFTIFWIAKQNFSPIYRLNILHVKENRHTVFA